MQPRVQVLAGAAGEPVLASGLAVRRSLAWPVGRADVVLSSALPLPEVGEEVSLKATDAAGVEQTLLTGQVVWSLAGGPGGRFVVEEATGRLARLRLDRHWEATTADAVIRELAGEGEVETGTLSPGATLPALSVARERPVLDHIVRLARLSGLVAWVDAAGALRAELALPLPGPLLLGPEQAVMEALSERLAGEAAEVYARGDGAMGTQGPEAAGWVLSDPKPLSSGDPGAGVHACAALLKSAADVEKLALGEGARLQEQGRGVCVTSAQVLALDLFDVLTLQGFAAGDGPARVVGLEVQYDELGYRAGYRLHGLV